MKKICPLCNQELVYEQSEFSRIHYSYVCPKNIHIFKDRPITHYRLSVLIEGKQETIFILPYKLNRYSDNLYGDKCHLYKQREVSDFHCSWSSVVTCPAFPISSEDQLRTKIKTLITFS